MKEVKEIVQYWLKTADHDYETMKGLQGIARYSDALFFGHIVLEKIFKALVVKKTKEHAPYIHDLSQLQKLSGFPLDKDDLILLDEVNDFNIRARYPEQKLEFYKKATKEYAEKYIIRIIDLYQRLCKEAKS
jgi:HEPN domain-containing protein